MKITPIDTVLFNPLSWMHPSRVPLKAGFDDVRQRSIINQMIIDAHGWATQRPAVPETGLAAEFIHQWRFLPQVALLIACQRHRASLSRQGRLMSLPAWLRSFAQLDIVASIAPGPAPVGGAGTLLAWGKYELITGGQRLPAVIRQRIPLLFSSHTDSTGDADPPITPSPLLLKLAFQHAKRNPDTPDAAEFRRCFDQARPAAAAATKP